MTRVCLGPLALLILIGAGCGESHPESGSETNWLLACSDDADCGVASCVCGVCTLECEVDDPCGAAPAGYGCSSEPLTERLCEGGRTLGLCLPDCADADDCRAEQRCVDGSCLPTLIAATVSGAENGGGTDAGMQRDADVASSLAASGQVDPSLPSVMLIVDTSGSMERLPGCECVDAACLTCVDGRNAMPDCSLEAGPEARLKNRWAVTLEALTGTFEGFGCEALERTVEGGATYDLGFPLDYHRPIYLAQAADGILDVYGGRVRFGVGTFDGMDTYVGAPPLVTVEAFDATSSGGVDGLWSIGSRVAGEPRLRPDGTPAGFIFYPGCTQPYFMDTGLRSADALDGPLVLPATERTTAAVEASLLGARPYGGTPIAAALDDLQYLYASGVEPGAVAQRYAVLLTDGYPDEDYRDYGCACSQNVDPSAADYCGGPGECEDPVTCSNHPSNMRCPYPAPEHAARLLVEGYAGHEPVLSRLFVVAMSLEDGSEEGAAVLARLDAIAEAGGSDGALRATTVAEVRGAVAAILADIGAD